MILDGLLYIVYVFLYGIISILPTMEILPDSFNDAWEFFATAIGNFLWIAGPSLAGTIILVANIITYASLLLFAWMTFTNIWRLIRG